MVRAWERDKKKREFQGSYLVDYKKDDEKAMTKDQAAHQSLSFLKGAISWTYPGSEKHRVKKKESMWFFLQI